MSKLAGLRKAFRERAATWFEVAYNNKLPTTYEQFQTDFKAMWLLDELVRAAKERFFRLTQGEDESPLDYLMRLKWHRMEISDWVSESDLLGRAQSGLLDKYRCQGLGLEKTLTRFEEKVRALAARESVREESAPHVARGPKRETDRPKPADRREPERRPVAGPKPRRDEPRRDRPEPSSSRVGPTEERQTGRDQPERCESDRRPESRTRERRCFYCQKAGHFIRDCRLKKENEGQYTQDKPATYRQPGEPPVIPDQGVSRPEPQAANEPLPRRANWRKRRRRQRRRSRPGPESDTPLPSEDHSDSSDSSSDESVRSEDDDLVRLDYTPGRMYHSAVIDGRLYKCLIETGGARSLVPLEVAMWHRSLIAPGRKQMATMDGSISRAVIGEILNCPVTIGRKTVRVPMLVVDGAKAPIIGHDVLASLGLVVDVLHRILAVPDPGLQREMRRHQLKGDKQNEERPSFQPYTRVRAHLRDQNTYRHGRVEHIPKYTAHARERARRAVTRERPTVTIRGNTTTSPGPNRLATLSSPEEEWFAEAKYEGLDEREGPESDMPDM